MTDIKIDRIVRSKRRTLALHITPDASLIIRAPLRMPLDFIEKFVHKKRSWVQKKQKIIRLRLGELTPKQFVNGERFLYLGNAYHLTILENDPIPISFNQGFYLSREHLGQARELFIRWYKKEAAVKIKERLDWVASARGLTYNKIKITSAQKRWGSCTSCNNLNFSWRLVLAPLEIIDYVVSHELTHLLERNHSRRFWKKLSSLFPGFKQCRIWLRENEHLLNIF